MLNTSRSEVFSTPSTTMCMTQRSDLENTELIYNEKEFFVYINVRGVATFDSICRVFDQVVSSDRYKPHMGRIWDFSLSDLSSLDGNAISRLSKHINGYPAGINDAKVAWVTERRINMGICTLLKAYSSEYQQGVEAFDSLQEAANWIKVQEAAH